MGTRKRGIIEETVRGSRMFSIVFAQLDHGLELYQLHNRSLLIFMSKLNFHFHENKCKKMKKISRNDHFPFPIIMPIINWPSIPHVHPLVSRSKIERTEEGDGRMWNRQKRTKIKLCRDEWNWSRSMNRCWNEWMIILSLLLPFLRLRLYLRCCLLMLLHVHLYSFVFSASSTLLCIHWFRFEVCIGRSSCSLRKYILHTLS